MKRVGFRRGLRRWVRYQYIRLVRLDDSPEKIARGVALGVVLGILPTFGLGVVAAIILAGYLKLNKASAVIGTLIMNPWTSPFFWALSYLAGSLLLGYNLQETVALIKYLKTHEDVWKNLLAQRLLLPYIIGNIIITAGSAATSYIACLYAVKAYKRARSKRNKGKQAVGV